MILKIIFVTIIGFNLNSSQADELMDKMDENRDGYVDKDEFNNFMHDHF